MYLCLTIVFPTLIGLGGATPFGGHRPTLWEIAHPGRTPARPNTHKFHHQSGGNQRPYYYPVSWRGDSDRLSPRSDMFWRADGVEARNCEDYDGNPLGCKANLCHYCCSDSFCYENESDAPDCIQCRESELVFSRNFCNAKNITTAAGLFYMGDQNLGRSVYRCAGKVSDHPRIWNISDTDVPLYEDVAWTWGTESSPFRAPVAVSFLVVKDGVYDILMGFSDVTRAGNGNQHREMNMTLNQKHTVFHHLDTIHYKYGHVCYKYYIFMVKGNTLVANDGGTSQISNKMVDLELRHHQINQQTHFAAIISTVYVSRRR